jgi:hypothetical protein
MSTDQERVTVVLRIRPLDVLCTDGPTVLTSKKDSTKVILNKTEQDGAVLASQLGFSHEYTFDSVCFRHFTSY